MSFDIQIKVDPSGAPAAIAAVTDALSKAEQKGKTTGDAISQGLVRGKSSADAAAAAFARVSQAIRADALNATGQGFSGLAQHMQRAAEMFERIKGPAMEAQNNLVALNEVWQQGKISGEEYVAMLRELNSAQSSQSANKGMFEQLGGAGIVSGGIAAGGIAVFQQLGNVLQEVSDKYREAADRATDFQNHAMKFVDGGNNLNKVLGDQQQLAHDLHAPLKDTMDLYDAIGDATSELNLSQRQLAAITKNVGEATEIANKPLASAGDIISRLAVGFEAGGDASRSVKKLIADYKDLSDVWTSAFHTSKAGLLEMVRDHKLTFEQMTLALGTNTQATTAAFAVRHRTYASEKRELDDLSSFYRQAGEGETEALAHAIGKFEQLDNAVKPLADHFKLLSDNMQTMATSSVNSTAMLSVWVPIIKSIGIAGSSDLKMGGDFLQARRTAMEELAGLQKAENEGMIQGAGAVDYYRKKWEELTTTIDGRLPATYTELHKLHDPIVDAQRDLGALDTLLKQGKISWNEYADEAEKARAVLDKYKPVASVTGGHLAAPAPDGISDDVLFRASYASAQKPDPKAYDAWEAHARDAVSGVDRGWKEISKDATDSAKQIEDAMTGALGVVETSLEDMVTKGKFDLGSLASSIESILVKLAVQQATGSLIGAIGGGRTGFDYMTPGGPGPALPGFATGGDMLVGGAGAPDSKLAMFRVSPGESIHVRTPEQRAAASTAGGTGGGTVNHNYFTFDPKALNKSIDSGVQKYIKENRTAVKALLGV